MLIETSALKNRIRDAEALMIGRSKIKNLKIE